MKTYRSFGTSLALHRNLQYDRVNVNVNVGISPLPIFFRLPLNPEETNNTRITCDYTDINRFSN